MGEREVIVNQASWHRVRTPMGYADHMCNYDSCKWCHPAPAPERETRAQTDARWAAARRDTR